MALFFICIGTQMEASLPALDLITLLDILFSSSHSPLLEKLSYHALMINYAF